MGSNVERGNAFGNFGAGGYSGFLINTWEPEINYGISDFDVTHQVNFNWIWDLPFGQGRRFAGNAGGFVNQFIGDWSVSGLTRWTSGFPFSVQNCRLCWPTNWNLQGNATLIDSRPLPETGNDAEFDRQLGRTPGRSGGSPGLLPVLAARRGGRTEYLPGRRLLQHRPSVTKAWGLFGDSQLRFRWDVFNVTNTPKFDVASLTMLPDRTGFGRYSSTLATCDAQAGRCMQFALRYEF